MLWVKLGGVFSVNEAIPTITGYLDDTEPEGTTYKAVYFDGWGGLAASAVLKNIAQAPPPSLKKKFDKIIHIDCSRWKSRRTLQRAIADELNLPQRVMAAFDREDEEDDFSGIDEDSRAEIASVTIETYQAFKDITCLVIFHNGSDSIVDFSDFGFPQFNWFSPCTLLWTFRGRLRLDLKLKEEFRGNILYIRKPIDEWEFDNRTSQLILEEAAEVVKYTQHKQSITPRITAKCISYLLWLNKKGGDTMEYNWGTHASNYWVCDGIIEDSHFDESWEVSFALQQQLRVEYCSPHTVNFPDDLYTEHWKSVVYTSDTDITVSPKLTSFFLAVEEGLPLPRQMFQLPKTLRVLKLCGCNFSFCSPPFQCCRSLRFLGLDSCKDQQQDDEHDKQGQPVMEFFQTLFVLDISHMDWELDLPQDIIKQMAVNIREVHVKKGRIWRSNLAWRQLQNIRKLRIINPTSSWETGRKDEFIDMTKLELLDLSGNHVMQVLPSLCGATRLKTLVLDGCAGLEHVGPKELPPALESFSLNAGAGKDGRNTAKISYISLAGSAKLVDFRLLGSMPNLEELDLSGTALKILDLKKLGEVKNLQRIFLIGCKQLHAIVWPETGMQQLRLVCIDTRQEAALRETSCDSLVCQEQEKYCHAHVCITDMRFIQSLLLERKYQFFWGTAPFKVNLYLSCTSKDDGKNCNKGTMGFLLNRTGQVTGSPSLGTSLISKIRTLCAYNDVNIEETATEINGGTALQFDPQHLHVEIGEGTTINTNMVSAQGIRALEFLMDRVQSLYLHDNSSITAVLLEHTYRSAGSNYLVEILYRALKWCRVERCPMLETVFIFGDKSSSYRGFHELDTFWAADLLMASSIWSGGRPYPYHDMDNFSFPKLRAIHLHMCPRLQFVLPFSWNNTLPSLETLHIVCCRGLKQVFPVEAWFLNKIATKHQDGMLEFPKLKHLYLHDLSSLQQICEAKIFAPKLETVCLRGCWGLRRLPATDRHRRDRRLVDVDCEKDWWEHLEWDGLHVGHDPSLFAPRHSAYYKKRHLRATVLR